MFNNRRNFDEAQLIQDFNALQLEKQRLNLQVMQMTSNYYNAQKDANYYQNQYRVLEDAIKSFCHANLSNDYNTAQLGGNNALKNIDILQLIEFTKNDFAKQKTSQLELIKRLKTENDFLNQRIQQLQNSLDNALEMQQISNNNASNINENKETDLYENLYEEPVTIVAQRNDVPNYQEPSFGTAKPQQSTYLQEKPKIDPQSVVKKKVVDNSLPQIDITMANSKTIPKYVPQNIETIINTLTKSDLAVIEAIGSQGFSESIEIVNYLQNEPNKLNRSSVMNSLSTLVQCQIIQSENVSTGLRTQLAIYKLSNTGMQVYKEKFGSDPVKADCDKIREDHDNLKHGYNIKDCATLIEKHFDCKSIEMQRDVVSIKLPGGETYIPDIVARLKNKQTLYIEVELGNTEATSEKQDNDFYRKCEKMFKVTKIFFIVSDNQDTKRANEQKISNWIVSNGGMSSPNLKGLMVYSVTVRDLQKGQNNIMKKPYIHIK